ncbi:MAG: GNAT family N-acetyltransferase [Candidatus Aenigmarchaeota archaeon]|nr:GNAT family N-acetyltransferase [Candidatus Aenigmarchaeota archaeon]
MIRKAEERDYSAVEEMYFSRSTNRFLYYDPIDRNTFRSKWKKMLTRKYSFVCERRRTVVGFITCVRKIGQEKHIAYIGPVVVRPGMKSNGVGAEMMEYILQKLKYTSRFKRIEMVVNSDNSRAVKFFRKWGFEVEAVLKRHTERNGEYLDDFLMVKFFQ